MTRAVIFDLDGTLVNLPIDYEGTLFPRFSKISGIEKMHPVTETIGRLDPETKGKIFQIWDEVERNALEKMTVNDKGMAIYTEYSKKPKALITMQGKTAVRSIAEVLGLRFDVIVTREYSLDRLKQLQHATRELSQQPQNVLFIGNTEGDSAAARAYGCQFLKVEK